MKFPLILSGAWCVACSSQLPMAQPPAMKHQEGNRPEKKTIPEVTSMASTTGTLIHHSAEADVADSSALPDLDILQIANITATTALPEQCAAWAAWLVGGLMLIASINSTIKEGLSNMPEFTMFLYVVLLIIFSWMTCHMYWNSDDRDTMWKELGPYVTSSGLFAESMLLITPLLLLIPNQEAAKKDFGHAQQRLADQDTPAAKRCEDCLKLLKAIAENKLLERIMLAVYLILAVFQISSVYAFYKLAEMRVQKLTDMNVLQIEEADKSTYPFAVSICYLVMAWCSLLATYDYSFGASFEEEFPRKSVNRIFDGEVFPSKIEKSDKNIEYGSPAVLKPIVDKFKSRAEAFAEPVKQGVNKIEKEAVDIKEKIEQMLPDGPDPDVSLTHRIHGFLYFSGFVFVLVVVITLEIKMLFWTAGITAWSLLFLVLTSLLLAFTGHHVLRALIGTKAADDQPSPDNKPEMNPQPDSQTALPGVGPAGPGAGPPLGLGMPGAGPDAPGETLLFGGGNVVAGGYVPVPGTAQFGRIRREEVIMGVGEAQYSGIYRAPVVQIDGAAPMATAFMGSGYSGAYVGSQVEPVVTGALAGPPALATSSPYHPFTAAMPGMQLPQLTGNDSIENAVLQNYGDILEDVFVCTTTTNSHAVIVVPKLGMEVVVSGYVKQIGGFVSQSASHRSQDLLAQCVEIRIMSIAEFSRCLAHATKLWRRGVAFQKWTVLEISIENSAVTYTTRH